jgi:hypothetical protein
MGLKWVCVWALSVASAAAQENPGSITGALAGAGDGEIPVRENLAALQAPSSRAALN